MTARGRCRVVFVTAPGLASARRLAQEVLQARAAACVNLVRGVESRYWWRGRVESSREVLLLIKTTAGRLRRLEHVVHAHHPYDTPEFVVLPIVAGSRRYLAWLGGEVRPRGPAGGSPSRA